MTNKNQQTIQVENGAYILLPPYFQGAKGYGNVWLPNVYAEDTVQQYPESALYVEGERKFRYAYFRGKQVGGAVIHTSLSQENGVNLFGKFLFNESMVVDYANSLTYGLVDTPTIEIWTTSLAAEKVTDYYSGGWVKGYSASMTHKFLFRRIVAHDYAAAKTVGGTARTLVSTLTVDQNLVETLASMQLSITGMPFKQAVWHDEDANGQYYKGLGMCLYDDPTYDRWIWLQTAGPAGSGHITNDFAGAEEGETKYQLMADGSIQAMLDQVVSYGQHMTIAYSLPNTASETGSGEDQSYPIIYIVNLES